MSSVRNPAYAPGAEFGLYYPLAMTESECRMPSGGVRRGMARSTSIAMPLESVWSEP